MSQIVLGTAGVPLKVAPLILNTNPKSTIEAANG
jgi:hypothetical protein